MPMQSGETPVRTDTGDEIEMAAVYQQIADRRALLENADILRRGRAL